MLSFNFCSDSLPKLFFYSRKYSLQYPVYIDWKEKGHWKFVRWKTVSFLPLKGVGHERYY